MHLDPLRPLEGGAPPDGDFAGYVERMVEASRLRLAAAVRAEVPTPMAEDLPAVRPAAPADPAPRTTPSPASGPAASVPVPGQSGPPDLVALARRGLSALGRAGFTGPSRALLLGGAAWLLLGGVLGLEPFADSPAMGLFAVFAALFMRQRRG